MTMYLLLNLLFDNKLAPNLGMDGFIFIELQYVGNIIQMCMFFRVKFGIPLNDTAKNDSLPIPLVVRALPLSKFLYFCKMVKIVW